MPTATTLEDIDARLAEEIANLRSAAQRRQAREAKWAGLRALAAGEALESVLNDARVIAETFADEPTIATALRGLLTTGGLLKANFAEMPDNGDMSPLKLGDGRTLFRQATEPEAPTVGDLWFNPDKPDELRRWAGKRWMRSHGG